MEGEGDSQGVGVVGGRSLQGVVREYLSLSKEQLSSTAITTSDFIVCALVRNVVTIIISSDLVLDRNL